MKRVFFVINLLFISVLCFPQQSTPRKIIGQIPKNNSSKLYQIQVGAFKVSQNAENTSARLRREGFSPVYEKYLDFTRVMVTGIPANQIQNYLTKIKQMGFDEVIIREDIARNAISEKYSISEKWEVTTPGSAYASFEFNNDYNYIVVENAESEDDDKPIHFGKYTMPSKDVINLSNLGI